MRCFWILLALTALCVFTGIVTHAQTPKTQGPYSTADRLEWIAPDNVLTIADAQALEARLYINGGSHLVVPGQVCTGTPITCRHNLSEAAVKLLNLVGQHVIRLSVNHATGGESPQSLPFSVKAPPAAPTGLRITPSAP